MSKRGFAYFVERPRRIEELKRPHPVELEREYEAVKTIRLTKLDYENFVTDMLADRQFLEDDAAACGREGNLIRCLRVTCRGVDESVLVVAEGAWVGIAALTGNHTD